MGRWRPLATYRLTGFLVFRASNPTTNIFQMEIQTLTAQTLQACRGSSAQGGNPSLVTNLKCCKVSPKSSSVEGRTPEWGWVFYPGHITGVAFLLGWQDDSVGKGV